MANSDQEQSSYDPETGEIHDDYSDTVVEDTATQYSAEGIEIVSFISAKHCLPSSKYLREHVVEKGAGFRMDLAQLVGWCKQAKRQPSPYVGSDGKPRENISLVGHFKLIPLPHVEGLAPLESSRAFLPEIWAERVERAVKELDPKDPDALVEMILTIGAQATGKQIEHRWTIRSHLVGQEDPALTRLERIAAGKPVRRLAGPRDTTARDIAADRASFRTGKVIDIPASEPSESASSHDNAA